MTKTWMAISILAGSLAALGCSSSNGNGNNNGGSSSSSGSSGGGGSSGGVCTPAATSGSGTNCSAYTTCVESNCGSDYALCFGSGWQSGNFSGGACAAYVQCEQGCGCTSSCGQSCYTSIDSACTGCLSGLGNCASAKCSTQLNQCTASGSSSGSSSGSTSSNGSSGSSGSSGGTGAPTGDGGSTGITCAQLSACCSTLSGSAQSGCNAAVSSKYDAACAAIWTQLGCK